LKKNDLVQVFLISKAADVIYGVINAGCDSAAESCSRILGGAGFVNQFGWALKPLGKPAQNARKWFATIEIARVSQDPESLDEAIRIIEKQMQEMNKKQRGKEQTDMSLVQ
jgi:hypothetical protein